MSLKGYSLSGLITIVVLCLMLGYWIWLGHNVNVNVHGSAIEERLEPTWQEKMLERLREWNIMKAINETLALSERFEK